jgi:tetratricopeptide (TPR) repeat protein
MKLKKLHCAVLTASIGAVISTTPVYAQPTASSTGGVATKAPARPVAPAATTEAPFNASGLFQIIMSEIALQRGQLGAAYSTYLSLAREQQDARFAQRAVEIAAAARAWEQALEAARLWARLDANNEEAQNTVRALLVETGRLSEIEPYLQRQIAAAENKALAIQQIQRSLVRAPNKAEALLLLDRLTKEFQTISSVRLDLASTAVLAQNYDRALQEARQALVLDARSETAALLTTQLLMREQKTEPAQAVLEQFIQDNPQSVQSRLQLARLRSGAGQHQNAQALLQEVLAREPKNLEVWLTLGQVQYQARRFDQAKQTLDEYLKLAAERAEEESAVHNVLFIQADIAQARRRFDEGITYLKRIESGEHYLSAQSRIAQLMAKAGRVSEATALLRALPIRNEAEASRLIMAEANVLREAQQYQAAYDLLSSALKKAPDSPELLYDYAMAAEKIDKLDDMERALKRFSELRPDDAHGYNALGYSWADRNMRLPEALALIQKALTLTPEEPSIIDSLGWVYFRLGQLDNAVKHLQRAYFLYPSAEIAAHLGEALWVRGERDKAREVWRAGLDKDPNDTVLLETLKRLRQSL